MFSRNVSSSKVFPAEIDGAAFGILARILRQESGIVLAESKKSLVVSRLSRRLRELNLADFSEYCDLLGSAEGATERREMVTLLTTNVTNFFREAHHFESLQSKVLPGLVGKLRAGKKVRFWSAGCSSGQEPYSIAIACLEFLPDIYKYDFKILATDIDMKVIDKGKRGIYSDLEIGQVSPERLNKFFCQDKRDSSVFSVADSLRAIVAFDELNLIREWPKSSPYDVIFCRNVVIYFDLDTQASLWSRFSSSLASGGHLFVGHSERVSGVASSLLKLTGTTQYVKS